MEQKMPTHEELEAAAAVVRKMSTMERAEMLDDIAEETGEEFTSAEFAKLNEDVGYEGKL